MMRWTEINTKPELLEKYAAHFNVDDYGALVRHVKELFTAARAKCQPSQTGSIRAEPHPRLEKTDYSSSEQTMTKSDSLPAQASKPSIVAPYVVSNRKADRTVSRQLSLPFDTSPR
jgi:hypothetical protein